MNGAKLSILGLYRNDPEIFDDLVIPSGISKEDLINKILTDCAELEIVFPDPVFMKFSIGTWSRTNMPVWQKLYNTTILEYNPIWNVDGRTEDKETRNLAGSNNRADDFTRTDNLTRNFKTPQTGDTVRNLGSDTESVAGFNSNTLVTNSKHDIDNTQTSIIDDTETNTGTVRNAGTSNNTSTDTGTVTHEIKRTGNIGVTTTQQMIEEERKVSLFNIYQAITDDFKKYYCLLVY